MLAGVALFFGLIAALVIWALEKDKSRLVRFQAFQAMAFEFVVVFVSLVYSFCLMAVMVLGAGALMYAGIQTAQRSADPSLFLALPMLMPFELFACILPFSILLLVIRGFAAISVLSGRDFRYPWLGRQVEQVLMEEK